MVEVTLSEEQVQHATAIGVRRHMEAVRMKLPDKHGMRAIDGLSSHVNGACGELAVAIALDVPWDGSVNVFKVPDVLSLYVRTRSEHWHDLIIRKDDPPGTYLLVTGVVPTFRIHGFSNTIVAFMDRKYLKQHGGREEAAFVPQSALGSFEKKRDEIRGRIMEGSPWKTT